MSLIGDPVRLFLFHVQFLKKGKKSLPEVLLGSPKRKSYFYLTYK
jgi:hypothetical protein